MTRVAQSEALVWLVVAGTADAVFAGWGPSEPTMPSVALERAEPTSRQRFFCVPLLPTREWPAECVPGVF
jgi:hypothetical protein